MSRYYCPFCSSRYQMHETRTDGVLICKQCGDPLMKRPLLNSSLLGSDNWKDIVLHSFAIRISYKPKAVVHSELY